MRRVGEGSPVCPAECGQSDEPDAVDVLDEPVPELLDPESEDPLELDDSDEPDEPDEPVESDDVVEEPAGVVDDELPRLSFL